MKKIALEEHFITTDFIKYTKQDFVNFDEKTYKHFIDLLEDFENERLQAMDQADIELAVLSLTDPGVQREPDTATAIKLARKANDFLAAAIQKRPDRFKGFAHLALQDPKEAAHELERSVKEYKFLGALINGQTNGHYLDEAIYTPFWEKVNELDVPIYLQPGNFFQMPQNYNNHPELEGAIWGSCMEAGTHALRLVFSGLFDKFPRLKIILGHMGETLPYLLWRFDSRWKLMKEKKIKKQPSEYIQENFAVTISGMCSNEPLQCAIGAMGEDNVMFSVGYPYESTKTASEFIENAAINQTIREKICYKNAERILKIKNLALNY